jgi:hypothetical protein
MASFACQYAATHQAAKVIFMLIPNGIHDAHGRLLNCLDKAQAQALLTAKRLSDRGGEHRVISGSLKAMLECAIEACEKVERIHFIGSEQNTLLEELFTSLGSGTLLVDSLSGYTRSRRGRSEDAANIASFMKLSGLALSGAIKPEEFLLRLKDEGIVATLRVRRGESALELDCIAVQPGLPVDEYFDMSLAALMESESMAQETIEIVLSGCHDWILLSQVPVKYGFFKKPEGGSWLRSPQ